MKSAKEFWKETFGEYPQNDVEKLSVTMMQQYYKLAIEQSRWISVDDRLPVIGHEVLWIDKNRSKFVERIIEDGSTFLTKEWFIIHCTHWQELPKDPE